VRSAVFSSDGTRVLTLSIDKTATVWDAASGSRIATLEHLAPISAALFSHDGMQVL
jgi:WD40 repeat protein